MSVQTYQELKKHKGHKIHIVNYSTENIAIECDECWEVLLDFDNQEHRQEINK